MLANELTFNFFVGILLFLLGSIIGSFLNVVAWRLPREESIIRPSSRCPSCKNPISVLGLIPIFGYLLLRGKCEHCKVRVSPRYPIVEFFTGVATVFVFFHFANPSEILYGLSGGSYPGSAPIGRFYFQSFSPMAAAFFILFTGIPLTLIDLDLRILPDVITIPGTFFGFILGALNPDLGWQGSLIGILVGAGGIYAVAKIYEIVRKQEGLGLGDVKYLALIGSVTGWIGVLWVITFASLIGLIGGVILMMRNKGTMKTAIPFGPFLAAAALVEVLFGNTIRLYYYS